MRQFGIKRGEKYYIAYHIKSGREYGYFKKQSHADEHVVWLQNTIIKNFNDPENLTEKDFKVLHILNFIKRDINNKGFRAGSSQKTKTIPARQSHI